MADSMQINDSYREAKSRLALHFFLLSGLTLGIAFLAGWGLIQLYRGLPEQQFGFPRAFIMSSICLLTGSIALERASMFVSRQRLRPFQGQLIVALISGTFFVALQIFGMWVLLRSQEPGYAIPSEETAVALGVRPYVFVAAFLHAIHFFLALLFEVYVTLNGLAGRYDHEYYWGVRVCAWFWHGLGILWVLILCVFLFVAIA